MTTRDEQGHSRIKDGIEGARAKAGHAAHDARDKARQTARTTAATIEANPVGVLVGGLAVGALIGAIVPRSRREKELLAPVGKRVAASATAALAAAKDTGRGELEELGLTKSAAQNQARSLFDGVVKAAKSAGTAAAEAGKNEAKAH